MKTSCAMERFPSSRIFILSREERHHNTRDLVFRQCSAAVGKKNTSRILVSAICKEKRVPVARRRGAWYKLRVSELPTWSRTPRLVPSLRRKRRSHCAASLGVGGATSSLR